MRSFQTITPLLASLLAKTTVATSAYSTRMINSVIARQQGLVSSGEATSTLESGLIALSLQSWLTYYELTADAETVSNITAYVEEMLATISATDDFTNITEAVSLPLDRLSVGQAIGDLDEVFSEGLGDEVHESPSTGGGGQRELTENEVQALNTLNTSLALQNRNQYGGFWYVWPLLVVSWLANTISRYYVYPNWSYLDGTVSFLPFMASSSSWSYADMLNQITLLWTFCSPQTNATANTTSHDGLLVHGYDASKTAVWANPVTGGSPYVWGRSLGWYLMGLVNAWEELTTDSDSCREDSMCEELMLAIQSQFTSLVHNLVPYADAETGAWWQLTTFPGRAGNFLESSSTALFVFSILKGLRLDLLTKDEEIYHHANLTKTVKSLTEVSLRAYDALVNDFVVEYGNGTLGYNGTVIVCSLNSTATYEYYTQRPINFNAPLGEGAFILASLEVERLDL